MTGTVHIEVMIDTNANSRRIRQQFEEMRDGVWSETMVVNQQVEDFRTYLQRVQKVTGMAFELTQRDTAQIFHEKTHTLTPELAKQAGIVIYPDFVRKTVESDYYHVEPPIYGEEKFYAALRRFAYIIQEDKAPGKLAAEGYSRPEDIDLLRLQSLYREHFCKIDDKYRNRPFKAEFDQYQSVRFNCGETTAVEFVKAHPYPPTGDKTAFLFISDDKDAKWRIRNARRGKGKKDANKLDVYVLSPRDFLAMVQEVVSQVEAQHPERAALRDDLPSFRSLGQKERKASNRMEGFHQKQKYRKDVTESVDFARAVKDFGRFVLTPAAEDLPARSPRPCREPEVTPALLDSPPPPLSVEVTLDTEVCGRSSAHQAILDAQTFLKEVKQQTGWDVSLIQREPSQIYYEKTGQLKREGVETPRARPFGDKVQAELVGKRRFFDVVQAGDYVVDAPGQAEAAYLSALKTMAADYTAQSPAMQRLIGPVQGPEDFDDEKIQKFVDHFKPPLKDPYRKTPAFINYAHARAKAGPDALTEAVFRQMPPHGDRKLISIIASNDQNALNAIHLAAKQMEVVFDGRVEIITSSRRGVAATMENLVDSLKKAYPNCADIPYPLTQNMGKYTTSVLKSREKTSENCAISR